MHWSLLISDISVAIFLWGDFFFATCFCQMMFFCAKNNFSSHLATMAIGSAKPECVCREFNLYHSLCRNNSILCLPNIDSLNICMKKFDAKKNVFDKITAL